MKTRLLSACVLALLSCVVSLPAAAQSDGGLFGNIFKPPGAPSDHAVAENSETVVRLDRLENALRQLTGQIEQLQYRNQQLEAQVKRLQDEADARAGGPRAAAGNAPASAAPAARTPPAATAGKRSDAFDPIMDPAAPGAPQPLGSPGSASMSRPGQPVALPGGGSPRELYDLGQSQIQKQDFASAEQTFRQIIQASAGDRIIPDATFMLGESLFLRQNYSDAAASFLEVSTKYPNSTRAPEALLRLGQSLAGLGEKETACATFLEVDRKYPRAPSAIRQAVEREQKRVGC